VQFEFDRLGETIVPVCKLGIKLRRKWFKIGRIRNGSRLGIDGIADSIEQSPESYFGQEVPQIVTAWSLVTLVFESVRKFNDLFELCDSGVR
jgi:hypothetical protein